MTIFIENEAHNTVSGISEGTNGTVVKAARAHLRGNEATSAMAPGTKRQKSERETKEAKMKPGMTFKERAKLGMEMLSRQPQLTYEEALASVERVHCGVFPKRKEGKAKKTKETKKNEIGYASHNTNFASNSF